jgi:hypothetical protein
MRTSGCRPVSAAVSEPGSAALRPATPRARKVVPPRKVPACSSVAEPLEVGGDPGGDVLELEAGDGHGQHKRGKTPVRRTREQTVEEELRAADDQRQTDHQEQHTDG